FNQALETNDGLILWEAEEWQPRAWIDGSEEPVTVSENVPGRLRLELPAGSGGTLVVSQVDYPGWTARSDGQELAIQPYNGVLQAIDLPSGTTSVELTFRPESWNLWLAVAGLGAVVWLAAAVLTTLLQTSWGRQRLR